MINRSLKLFFGLALVAYATSLLARPVFFAAWADKYPNSNSDEIGCQLCHVNVAGNSPWNVYGWEFRNAYDANNFDVNAALNALEGLSLDGDPTGATVLDSIRAGLQPGWTEGPNNTFFHALAAPEPGNLPPEAPATTAYDFPAAIADPIPSINLGAITLELAEVATGFNAPVQAVRAPGIDASLFVVEQTGKIFRVDLATGNKSLFLDVSADLVDINLGYDERGLLGLAFHPNYQGNGLFYTYQSEPARSEQDSLVDFSTVAPTIAPNHRSMIVEYQASNPASNSSISKLDTLLIIDQPQFNHNGGDLAFGPDGYLYISLGDGGNADDQGPGHNANGTGRDNTTVLGSILRIDTSGSNSANSKYGIPNDNPFIADGDAGVDEIFAYGFRNPYRMSFDAGSGALYTGDVGQNQVEEIDKVVKGGNYGWNWKEGSFYFYHPGGSNLISNISAPGAPSDLVEPIGEYDHGDGISIIGGYVYRGSEISGAEGHYIFGDFSGPNFITSTGRLFYLNLNTNVISEFNIPDALAGYITGFGQDSNNELYIVTNDQFNPSGVEGKLWKLFSTPSEELCVPIKTASGAVTVICL